MEVARIINSLPDGCGFDFSMGCVIPPAGYNPHDPNWREKEALRRQQAKAEFERERKPKSLFSRFIAWLANVGQWAPSKVR